MEKKLSISIGLLSKIRHYVLKFLLKTIYYSIFNPHSIYRCEVCDQNKNNVLVQRLQKLQEKAVGLINFETNPHVVGQLLDPIQNGLFQGYSRMGGLFGSLPKIHHTYPTMMEIGTVIPYLRKI